MNMFFFQCLRSHPRHPHVYTIVAPNHRHAGGRCSKALTQILAQTVSREPDFSLELQSAVHKGFLRANAEFLRKAERFCANDGVTSRTHGQIELLVPIVPLLSRVLLL